MDRFVVIYQGRCDPSHEEERSLLSALEDVKVVDRMPGTLLVEGEEAAVAAAVGRCDNWSFSQERSFSVKPPHQRIKKSSAA